MKSITVMSLAVACLVLYAAEAFALERSCEAVYRITPRNVLSQPYDFGRFTVKGSCGNRAVANRCRERARNRAHRCMTDHLKSIDFEAGTKRGNYQPPPITCRGERFDSSIVVNYPFRTLVHPLKASVCQRYSPLSEAYEDGRPVVSVEVMAVTRGGKRCPQNGTKRRITIVCD